MAFTAFRDMNPFSQLMFSAFVILASTLAFMVVALLIAFPVFGLDSLMSIPSLDEINDPAALKVLKYFQIAQAIGLFIVPPLILGWLFSGRTADYLHLNKSFGSVSVLLIVVLMFFAAPFINLIGELNSNMVFPEWLSGVEHWMKNAEQNAEEITMAFLKVDTTAGLLFNLFMIAVLPAIGEELLFRGVIQRIFTRMTKNHHWGIWISAILFSALHMQFYGFVPRMLLGVLFGYLLVWSGSMWLPIIAHFLNNGIAVIAFYLIDKGLLNSDVEEIGSASGSYYMAAISLGLIIVLMLMIKQQNAATQIKLEEITE
jgi:membrane protease YdiL (CAAX protease family)